MHINCCPSLERASFICSAKEDRIDTADLIESVSRRASLAWGEEELSSGSVSKVASRRLPSSMTDGSGDELTGNRKIVVCCMLDLTIQKRDFKAGSNLVACFKHRTRCQLERRGFLSFDKMCCCVYGRRNREHRDIYLYIGSRIMKSSHDSNFESASLRVISIVILRSPSVNTTVAAFETMGYVYCCLKSVVDKSKEKLQ